MDIIQQILISFFKLISKVRIVFFFIDDNFLPVTDDEKEEHRRRP